MSSRTIRFVIYGLVGLGLFIWTQTRETPGEEIAETPAPEAVEQVEDAPAPEAAPAETTDVAVAEPNYGLEIDIAGQANGTIVIDLFEDVAPLHTAQIVTLASEGQYDGVVFHRVIEGFMAQTGDVRFGKGDDLSRAGMGGSELPNLRAEFSDKPFARGIVGMARSQSPNSANSQFFIMFDQGDFLNGQYTVIGEVTAGMDVVDQIKRGEGPNGAMIGAADEMVAVRVTQN